MAMLLASMLAAGCAGRWVTPEVFARHRMDGEYAQLLALYESGAINAEELTSRQRALAELHENLNRKDREDAKKRAAEDAFPATDTTDCKSRNDRHCSASGFAAKPDMRCPVRKREPAERELAADPPNRSVRIQLSLAHSLPINFAPFSVQP